MKEILLLFVHLLTTIARLPGPDRHAVRRAGLDIDPEHALEALRRYKHK